MRGFCNVGEIVIRCLDILGPEGMLSNCGTSTTYFHVNNHKLEQKTMECSKNDFWPKHEASYKIGLYITIPKMPGFCTEQCQNCNQNHIIYSWLRSTPWFVAAK